MKRELQFSKSASLSTLEVDMDANTADGDPQYFGQLWIPPTPYPTNSARVQQKQLFCIRKDLLEGRRFQIADFHPAVESELHLPFSKLPPFTELPSVEEFAAMAGQYQRGRGRGRNYNSNNNTGGRGFDKGQSSGGTISLVRTKFKTPIGQIRLQGCSKFLLVGDFSRLLGCSMGGCITLATNG